LAYVFTLFAKPPSGLKLFSVFREYVLINYY